MSASRVRCFRDVSIQDLRRRRQATAPTRARAERIVEGSGAGVGAFRSDEGAAGGFGGVTPAVEVPEGQGGGGIGGAQPAVWVWCQVCTDGAARVGGTRYSAAAWVIPEVGTAAGAGGIVLSCQVFRKFWRACWKLSVGVVEGVPVDDSARADFVS